MSLPAALHIVVTDINPHVREFLRRELAKEGYTVVGVKSAKSASERLWSSLPLDLIIIDPELFPSLDQLFIETLVSRRPSLHIIIHTYTDSIPTLSPGPHLHLVEKNGQSIGTIKAIIQAWREHLKTPVE